jgi:hypothetical protein
MTAAALAVLACKPTAMPDAPQASPAASGRMTTSGYSTGSSGYGGAATGFGGPGGAGGATGDGMAGGGATGMMGGGATSMTGGMPRGGGAPGTTGAGTTTGADTPKLDLATPDDKTRCNDMASSYGRYGVYIPVQWDTDLSFNPYCARVGMNLDGGSSWGARYSIDMSDYNIWTSDAAAKDAGTLLVIEWDRDGTLKAPPELERQYAGSDPGIWFEKDGKAVEGMISSEQSWIKFHSLPQKSGDYLDFDFLFVFKSWLAISRTELKPEDMQGHIGGHVRARYLDR